MIPVTPQPEPEDFDRLVRQPGRDYLRLHPDTKPSKLPAYWTRVIHDLWEKYNGICAYLAKYLPEPTGAVTTDHFVAKSKTKEWAYEWSNYRLASLGKNRKKNTDKVLDPFTLKKAVRIFSYNNA